ncbi:unnamed protein product [Victoria cruziana]
MELVSRCHVRSSFLLLRRLPSRNYINTRKSLSSSLSPSSSSSICVLHCPWRGRDEMHHWLIKRRVAAFASSSAQNQQDTQVGHRAPEPTEEDLDCVSQIKRVEVTNKKPRKSLYAKVTDTGVDPALAAKRLNIDWDTAAEIETDEDNDETDVPPAVGYGVLYLVTGLPIIIGISVVLILFYNSLQ